MVDRLGAIENISKARPLLQVLLKLFTLCAKVSQVQEILSQPEVGAMPVFLRILHTCLSESVGTYASDTEQILNVITVLFLNKMFLSITFPDNGDYPFKGDK